MTTTESNTQSPNKLVKTDFVDYHKEDSGILKINFKIQFNQTIDIIDAQSYVSIVVQMAGGKPQPVLLNFLKFSNLPNVKILNFLGKNKDLQKVSGPKAIVLNSYIVRMIITQYLKIAGNNQPHKIFKTEKEAMSWLKMKL